jgi:hypothetical protein
MICLLICITHVASLPAYDIDGEEGLERANQPEQQDPFAAFFGGGGGRGGKQKGPNMGSEAQVTLEELYNGGERKIHLQKKVVCPKCRGTGAKDGAVKKCHACNGQGVRMTMQQMMPGFNVQMQTQCDVCGGKGHIAKHKCSHCNGDKVVREDKTLEMIMCVSPSASLLPASSRRSNLSFACTKSRISHPSLLLPMHSCPVSKRFELVSAHQRARHARQPRNRV